MARYNKEGCEFHVIGAKWAEVVHAPHVSCKAILSSSHGWMNLNPRTDTRPATAPTRLTVAGASVRLAMAPMATPPANVAFCGDVRRRRGKGKIRSPGRRH